MKKFAAIVLITLFLAPVNQTFAAVKAGDTCKRAGQSSTVSGVTYSCVKKGKKFVWSVKTTKKSESPTANPTPTPAATATSVPTPTPTIDSAKYLATEPLRLPQSKDIQVGKPCSKASWPVVGYLFDGSVGYVVCSGAPGYTKWETNSQWLKVDAATRKPLIPIENQELTLDTRQPFAYIIPTLSTKSPATTISAREPFANVEPCRLKEVPGARSNSNMGFPIKSNRIPLDDRVVVQVIPVDFADVRSTTNPADDLADALSAIEVFWERQASKKVDIVIQVPDRYFNLKKNVLDYGLNIPYSQFGNGGGKNYWPFADEAAAAVDDLVDFSKVDIAIVTGPPAITDQQIGTFVAQKSVIGDTSVLHTKEKVIENFLIRGADEIRDIYNWIHEFGHMFGLTDFGHDGWADPSQNATNAGKGFFDIMTSYRSPELYVWHRFLLGVLNDSQIDCVTSSTKSTHLIRPVASSENVQKGVVIPLSSTEVLVIESRRRMGYDATLGKEGEGALVYKVDTSAAFGEQTGKSSSYVLSTAKSVLRDLRFSMPLKSGESVSYGGWKITVVESGEFGDVVSVEKG